MIPLFKPYIPHELPELNKILHSGQLAYGKYAREFEKNIAEYIGIDKVLCTNSFNSAYLVLIKTLDLQPGDEVVASPMCCLASTQPFAVSGIKLKWADIDPKTGTLDPESVKKNWTEKTKAIVHNHFCGYVGYVDEIIEYARLKGLFVIDDLSEAFGSEYKGKKGGNWGADATVYSFQTVRLPNSIDGGAISFKSETHINRAKLLRDYGIDRAIFRDTTGEISPDCDVNLPSYGCLPSEVNSYIGILSLKQTQKLIEKQRQNACEIEINLKEDLRPLRLVENTKPNYWVYGVKARDKRQFIERTRKERIMYVSGVHLPNTYYSLFRDKPHLLGVKEFFDHFVALPCGWWL